MSNSDFVITHVTVASTQSLTPHFMRVEFKGEELQHFGVDGSYWDQRIKLIFPATGGKLPDLRNTGAEWQSVVEKQPENERCPVRVYSVRDVRGEGINKRLFVDFVLHQQPGSNGPASTWAAQAKPGDRLIVVGPRVGSDWGGIEFDPGDSPRVVLAGDETAVPAISRILADLGENTRGHAFLEIPSGEDILNLDIIAPAHFIITWLPRNGADYGELLIPRVLQHLGTRSRYVVHDEEVDNDLWETPSFSSSNNELETPAMADIPDLYVWVAGESKVVTTLRRHLINDLQLHRAQVAFMGYWRRGVSMRG